MKKLNLIIDYTSLEKCKSELEKMCIAQRLDHNYHLAQDIEGMIDIFDYEVLEKHIQSMYPEDK